MNVQTAQDEIDRLNTEIQSYVDDLAEAKVLLVEKDEIIAKLKGQLALLIADRDYPHDQG
jgi:hypothetical protein